MRFIRYAALLLLVIGAAQAADKTNPISIRFEDVPGRKGKRVITSGIIKAPPSTVWGIIIDYESYKHFMPRVVESSIVDHTATTIRYKAKLDMPWPIANVSYECDVTFLKPEESLEFRLVPGSAKGVKQFQGTWTFSPLTEDPQQTNAVYTLLYEADRWYPGWTVEIGTRHTVAKIIESVRKQVAPPSPPNR